MSIEVMTFVWKRYPEGGSELLLALALADFADDDGTSVYPSVARMAAKTRMSERNIQYLLSKMKERGWLVEVEAGGNRNGRSYATEYRIPIEDISDEPMYGVQSLHPPVHGCKKERSGVQTSAENLRQVAPQPSLPVITHQAVSKKRGKSTPDPRPAWQASDAELIRLVEEMGRSTIGKSRDELIRILGEQPAKRARTA